MRTSEAHAILWLSGALALLPACHSHAPSQAAPATRAITPALTKPQKTVNISRNGLFTAVHAALDYTQLQIDQSGDPTYERQEWARRPVCTPPTQTEKTTCYQQNCSPPPAQMTLAQCHASCDAHQDCVDNVCNQHGTSNFVEWGPTMQKLCNAPTDSCPPCTPAPGNTVPLLDTVDTTLLLPNPIYTGTGVVCTAGRFFFNLDPSKLIQFDDDRLTQLLSQDASAWAVSVGAGQIVVQTRVQTGSPALACVAEGIPMGVDVTNARLSLTFVPYVRNHHVHVALSASFAGDVDYAFEWIAPMHDTVMNAINNQLQGLIARAQGPIDRAFEAYLMQNVPAEDKDKPDGNVDDIVSLVLLPQGAAPEGLTLTYTPWCFNGSCGCTPDCNGRSCGLDAHCGSVACGAGCPAGKSCAPDGNTCVCQPNCAGKTCGDDGCGGSCGQCPTPPYDVCFQNQCCAPDCTHKTCGDDGCGGVCGWCASGTTCSGNRCVCQPYCTGKSCGPDGCGGTCGSCASGETCSGGLCFCTPNCPSGATCHLDGCGGACGSCGKGVCDVNARGVAYCNRSAN